MFKFSEKRIEIEVPKEVSGNRSMASPLRQGSNEIDSGGRQWRLGR